MDISIVRLTTKQIERLLDATIAEPKKYWTALNIREKRYRMISKAGYIEATFDRIGIEEDRGTFFDVDKSIIVHMQLGDRILPLTPESVEEFMEGFFE